MKQKILLKKLVLFMLAIASLSVIAFAEEPVFEEDLAIELKWVYAEDVDLDVSDWAMSGDAISFFSLSPYEQMKASIVEGLQERKKEIYVKYTMDGAFNSDIVSQLYFNAVYSFPEETAHVVTEVGCGLHAETKTMKFIPVYLDEQIFDETAFKDAVDAAEAACFRSGMTNLEKVVAVHDWLVLNCQYDPYVAYNSNIENEEDYRDYTTAAGVTYTEDRVVYSPYGVFVEGNAVCQGYALAFQTLMNRAGIPCYFVSSENHAWNVVQLGEGDAWYYVDATWDDPVDIGGRGDLYGYVKRANFLKGEAAFKTTDTMQGGHASCGSWSVEYGANLNISDEDYTLPAGLANAADMAAYLIDDMFYLAESVEEGGKPTYSVLHQYEIGSNFKESVQVADGLPATIASVAWDEDGRTLYFLSGLTYTEGETPKCYYQYLYQYALDGAGESAEKLQKTTPVEEKKQYTMKLSEAENGKKELWTWYDYSNVDKLLTIDYYVEVEEGGYSYYTDGKTVWIKRDADAENMVLVVWMGSRNEFLKADFCTKNASYTGPASASACKLLVIGDTESWIPLCEAVEPDL